MMKWYKSVLWPFCIALSLVACNSREKEIKSIAELQLRVDSMLSSAEVLTPEQRSLAKELIDSYFAFADTYPEDTLGAAYLFEAARLNGRLPDFQASIDLFRRVADNYPQDDLAPKSLLSIAGIYDITMQDFPKAEQVYREIKEKYPLQSEQYGIDFVLQTLGKSPEEILMELQKGKSDTLDIANGVPAPEETDVN
ncbi:MAG: tetratricopeptide repeat protein [Chitinophagales bacterium]